MQQSKNSQCLATKKTKKTKNYQVCKEGKNRHRNEDKNQSIETDPEMTQMIEVVDKDMKAVIITIFHMFKKVGMLKYPKRHGIYFLKIQIEFEDLKKCNV